MRRFPEMRVFEVGPLAVALVLVANCGSALKADANPGVAGSVGTGMAGVGGTVGVGGSGIGGSGGPGGDGAGAIGGTGGVGGEGVPPCMPPPGATVPGGCLKVLTSDRPALVGPALDGSNVFWAETQAGGYAVMMVPVDGGTVQNVLGTSSQPIAIGGSSAYLQSQLSGQGVTTMPISAGARPIPFQGFGGNAVADSTAVYSIAPFQGSSLQIAPLDGGSPKIIGKMNGFYTADITVRDGTVFWTSATSAPSHSSYNEPGIFAVGTDGTDFRALLGGSTRAGPGFGGRGGGGGGLGGGGGSGAGGSGGCAGSGVTLDRPYGIAADATYVYWTDGASFSTGAPNLTTGTVARMPIAGCQATVLATGLAAPADLAIDDTALYFAGGDGTIKKIPLAGGAPVTLVSGQENPRGVTVDGTSVYWVSGQVSAGVQSVTGSIRKLTPK